MYGPLFVTRITFMGRHYVLVGETDGAIATERDFRTGRLGLAYLTPAGEVMRGGEVIGGRDDIGFGEVVRWPIYNLPPCPN